MDSQTEAHALCVHLSSSDAFSVEDSFTSVSVFFVTNSFQKYWFRSQSTGTLGGATNNLDKYLYLLYCVGFNRLYIPQI